MHASDRVEVPGSERELIASHARVGDVDPAQEIEVTVYLRPRADTDWVDAEAERAPAQRRRVAREQWSEQFGADPADVEAVQRFARAHELTVVAVDRARRAITVHGGVGAFADAFGAQLKGLYAPSEQASPYRGRTGPLTVPAQLDGAVVAVLGIDDRPQASQQLRRAAAAGTSYTPVQIAQAYAFPTDVTGVGETVGIIELGGGYQDSDLSSYFDGLGLKTPTVTAVPVDGGANSPGQDSDADGEVTLDIEVVGAVANDVKIAVYFTTNTDQGFIDAVSTAVHDTTHRPTVISISWGGPEDSWTAQARAQMEQVLTDAGGLGVTVTVAAGDSGSTDGQTDGQQHVDFPASAPHALACGGTELQASGSTISREVVWASSEGSTGGGVSIEFALPSYQSAAKVPDNVDTSKPGRGVPDVSADADPDTGYTIFVGGQSEVVGGTSAVAPLWAGLIALINQSLQAPVGFVAPRLYPLLGTASFHDITSGSNGSYSAGAGWDACTGLGSPDGTQLLAALGE